MSEPANTVVMDLDGVLGEYLRHLLRFGKEYFALDEMPLEGTAGNLTQMHLVFGVGRQAYTRMKAAYRQEVKALLPPVGGMPELTRRLTAVGVEVHVATSRPEDTHWLSRDWLNQNGFHYSALSTFRPVGAATKFSMLKKVLKPEAVIAVVEDNLGFANDALRRGFPVVYLRDMPYNQGAPKDALEYSEPRPGRPADQSYLVQRYRDTLELTELLARAVKNVKGRDL